MDIGSIPVLAIAFVAISSAQSAKLGNDTLVGDWRGDSICIVRPSSCNDEKALYHIKQLGEQANQFSVRADKIVNGQAVEMGAMECGYAPDQHVLTCSTPKLALRLTLKGNSLDGRMNLTDGTPWRNISLKKDGT